MYVQTDVLVIGSGIAGLTCALECAEYGQVTIVTKAELAETNTRYAQGGISSVLSAEDSFEQHVKDTLVAGAGLCVPEVVRLVCEDGPAAISRLVDWGVRFDRNERRRL